MTRARIACACAALSAVLAGCSTTTGTGATVAGSTLVVYASQPPRNADAQQAQDVLDGERLALQRLGNQVGHFTIVLKPVSGSELSDNARTAISDSRAIAYLGELEPASSADSLGITNGVGMLQISPTDTAIELTQPTNAVPNSPTVYYQSISNYGRTFGRVVPAANYEASVQAQEMRLVGVKRLYVADDGGAYGSAVALAVATDARADGITVIAGAGDATKVQAASADALFVGASNQTTATNLLDAVATTSPNVRLFVPSALDSKSFASGLSTAAQRGLVVSQPGFIFSGPDANLTAAGRTFVSDFRRAYARAPGQSAIFGYAAMQLLLSVLHQAGTNAASRSAVVTQFHDVKAFSSVLGTFSINDNGDTSLAPYVFSHVRAGKLVPFKTMQG